MRTSCITSLLLLSTFLLSAQGTDTTTVKIPTKAIRLVQYPVLWQQAAAEYRALCYQAFNLATLRLQMLTKKQLRSHPAIITDLDETILDNSFFDAQLIKEDTPYTERHWQQWVSQSKAAAVPGAVAFLQTAGKRGIPVFYISNRSVSDVQPTLANLKTLQLPNADTAHMLFLANTSSKEERRLQVMKKHLVVMLMGDNLNDFTKAFENKNVADRFAETDKARTDWGNKFIVLPNPTYGDWESAVYQYRHGLTDEQKEKIRLALLVGY